MRSRKESSSRPTDNVFTPAFLDAIQERDEVLTATEAEYSGRWKEEPVAGRPGAVAVLREWETLEHGDLPEAILWHDEIALLMLLLIPLLHREQIGRASCRERVCQYV